MIVIKQILVKKRDGTFVNFDKTKIRNAIYKANLEALNEKISDNELNALTDEVAKSILDEEPSVEEIQDTVERVLIRNNYADTAKAYIIYRNERTQIRGAKSRLKEIFDELTFTDAANAEIKRENANIDADTAMGTMLKYGSEGSKFYIDNNILPKDIAEAHNNGDIHIHDKDFYLLTETCCQIDLTKLFKGGFSTGHGLLREPNSIRSYAALACIAIQSNQNEMHGGQAVPNFDFSMAPGVAKTFKKKYLKNFKAWFLTKVQKSEFAYINDLFYYVKANVTDNITMSNIDDVFYDICDNIRFFVKRRGIINDSLFMMDSHKFLKTPHEYAVNLATEETNEETYQAMEAVIHNLNTMQSRAGAQVPFSSLNYGTDTSPEGRMVTLNLLKATEAGLGNGETPIFPVQIFKVKEGVNYNKTDPNYDLFKKAMMVSAKRLFPNFSFLDAPFNLQYYKSNDYNSEVAYMGCRTRVMGNIHDKNKEVTCGRGNLSFTSINLPRLGIEAHGDVDKFFSLLDDKIALVCRQLLHRFKIQCSKHVYNYPFLMGQGVWLDSEKLNRNDSVAEVLKHGSLTIGFIGLAECLKALIGKHHGESDEAQKLGLKIIRHMRKSMDEKAKETKLNFGLIGTPAEGLSGRFVALDKKKYGIIAGVTDKKYYTNSTHIPVYYPISAWKKIQLEAPYHELENAGHICYVELAGDPLKNLTAFENVIRYMHDNGVGYGSVNHPVDRDSECGYTGIIDTVCPRCGRTEEEHHIKKVMPRIKCRC